MLAFCLKLTWKSCREEVITGLNDPAKPWAQLFK